MESFAQDKPFVENTVLTVVSVFVFITGRLNHTEEVLRRSFILWSSLWAGSQKCWCLWGDEPMSA